jgi:hypothetical protein
MAASDTKTVLCKVKHGTITHAHEAVLDERGNPTGAIHTRRTATGEMFEASPEEAKRLVALGSAEYAR